MMKANPQAAIPPAEVISINTSNGGIPKTPQEHIAISESGLAGDEHNHEKHRTPLQAVSLIDLEVLEELKQEGFEVGIGKVGENITCRRLGCDLLEPGDVLQFSGGVTLEITKKRSPCYVLDAIDPTLKKAMIGRAGCYAKVTVPGRMQSGETISVVRVS
ncbi:MAG: MOSC domain-containing protein [Phycisphaerales bacterium]